MDQLLRENPSLQPIQFLTHCLGLGTHINISIQLNQVPFCQFFMQMASRLAKGPFSVAWMIGKSYLFSRKKSDSVEISTLITVFSGYGYQVCIVEDLQNLDLQLAAALQWAVGEIRKIQSAARSGKAIVKPRWPMIILRSPKVRISHAYTLL